jgi:hypothetical protein
MFYFFYDGRQLESIWNWLIAVKKHTKMSRREYEIELDSALYSFRSCFDSSVNGLLKYARANIRIEIDFTLWREELLRTFDIFKEREKEKNNK